MVYRCKGLIVHPNSKNGLSIRVAAFEIDGVVCGVRSAGTNSAGETWSCAINAATKNGLSISATGEGSTRQQAVEIAVSVFCTKPIFISSIRSESQDDGHLQTVVAIGQSVDSGRAGLGRFVSKDLETGLVVAAIRAANHAGLLKADYRANNQQALRCWSQSLVEELIESLELENTTDLQRLEAECIVLEHTNRVASAAVLTAANHPKPTSILSLFDTSAWLFDSNGRRRDSYTDTDLWLAWYPGIENDELTVSEVMNSMPAAPESKIPWIVRLFENPESWIRFRGAVDLNDHDVLHVLLGRGLQDQDEAFVLGFAMGTAKRISKLEYWIFKFVLARIYPEPYRIPAFLQPAFDLGVQCGQQTGVRNLYRRALKDLQGLSLGEARKQAGIDMSVVRKFYELEQQKIPFTIASLRLP